MDYARLVTVLAERVFREWSYDEIADDGRTIRVFDNMCSSDRQIATGVLLSVGFLEPLDAICRGTRFVVSPDEFMSKATAAERYGCPRDIVILALIEAYDERSVDIGARDESSEDVAVYDALVAVGLISGHEAATELSCGVASLRGRPVPITAKVPERLGVRRIVWSPKKAFYDEMRMNWDDLIDPWWP